MKFNRIKTLCAPVLVSGIAAISGCTATMGEDGEHEPYERATFAATIANDLTTDAHAKILSANAEGSCAGHAPFIVAGVVDLASSVDISAAPCRLKVELEVPQGYQVGLPVVQTATAAIGFVGAPKLIAKERYLGRTERRATLDVKTQDEITDWTLPADRRFTSPSCGTKTRISYEIELSSSGLEFAALDRLLVQFRYDRGMKFRACGKGEVAPPSSAEGKFCGGAPRHPCVSGLVCDALTLRPRDGLEGTCVDPNKHPEPQKVGDFCGGPQRTLCDAEGVCSYESSERVNDPRAHGVCLRRVGHEDDTCRGHANTPCEAGFVCWNGPLTQGAAFGTCQKSLGEVEGAFCGGTPEIACAPHLSCATSSCSRTDGKVGARCGASGFACDENLTCFRGTCRDFSSYAEVTAGHACGPAVKRRCAAPLTCDATAICK